MSRLEKASKVQPQSTQSGFHKPTQYTSKLSSKDSVSSGAASNCKAKKDQNCRNVFDDTATFNYHEPKPFGSYSAPLRSPSQRPVSLPPAGFDEEERAKFMQEIERAKRDLDRFRNEMAGLAKQMDGMAVDLKDSKDRVCMYAQKLAEIEHDLTETQEVNVDLQILLENAVKSQKESDGRTNNIIRNLHSSLATIVYENSQLQDRLTSIENYQQKHQGTVQDVGEKIREYAQMLEQAQGTLQVLQAPRIGKSLHTSDDLLSALSVAGSIESRRTSELSSVFTDDDDVSSSSSFRKRSEMTLPSANPEMLQRRAASTTRRGSVSPEVAELYRHRIIRKRTSLPDTTASLTFTKPVPTVNDSKPARHTTSPQQGLKILLRNQGGQGVGLSSLAKRNS